MMLQTRMIYFDDLVGKFQESKDISCQKRSLVNRFMKISMAGDARV